MPFFFLFTGSFGFANASEVKTDSSENLKILIEFKENLKSDKLIAHTCYYCVLNTRGELVAEMIIHGVPDDVNCDSSNAIQVAYQVWEANT